MFILYFLLGLYITSTIIKLVHTCLNHPREVNYEVPAWIDMLAFLFNATIITLLSLYIFKG